MKICTKLSRLFFFKLKSSDQGIFSSIITLIPVTDCYRTIGSDHP